MENVKKTVLKIPFLTEFFTCQVAKYRAFLHVISSYILCYRPAYSLTRFIIPSDKSLKGHTERCQLGKKLIQITHLLLRSE
jgi:hypothetical protein